MLPKVVTNIAKHLPEEVIASLTHKNGNDLEDTLKFGRGISVFGPDVTNFNENTQQLVNWENCKANTKEAGISDKEFSFKWEEVKRPVNQEAEVCNGYVVIILH